jgi:hypothetical protein
LYIFFRDSTEIVGLKHENECRRRKFIICLASKGQSTIAVVHVDVGNVLYLHFLRLFAFYDELTLSLDAVGLTSLDFGNISNGILGGVCDLNRLGHYLTELAVEDYWFSLLQV